MSYDYSSLQDMVEKFIQSQRSNDLCQECASTQQQCIGADFLKCIGMIKSIWRNKTTNQDQFIDYGTAFAVSPHLILTCTHNLFHQDQKIKADEIVFVPNHKGYISPNTETYKSMKGEFCEFLRLEEGETLTEIPTVNELCLVAVSRPIDTKKFINIGLFQPKQSQSIEIIGFPSKTYAAMNNLLSVSLTREHLKGKILSIDGDIVNHSLYTKVGHSGSAIFCINSNNQAVAIGIHTHRRDAYVSQGLFFNKKVAQHLKKFEKILVERYKLSNQEICIQDQQESQNQFSQFHIEQFSRFYNQNLEMYYGTNWKDSQNMLKPDQPKPNELLRFKLYTIADFFSYKIGKKNTSQNSHHFSDNQ